MFSSKYFLKGKCKLIIFFAIWLNFQRQKIVCSHISAFVFCGGKTRSHKKLYEGVDTPKVDIKRSGYSQSTVNSLLECYLLYIFHEMQWETISA